MPGDVTLWPGITGGEVIDLLGRLRGGLDRRRRDELLERFDLDPRKKARTYSKGNRQKVALIAALASDAELLLLDEPTSGLDPLMESVFQQCIQEVKQRGPHGAAVQPHPRRGRGAVRPGEHHPARPHRGERHAGRAAAPDPHLDRGRDRRSRSTGIDALPGVHDVVVDDHHARFDVDTAHLDAVVRQLSALGVRSLTSTPPTLEELFLRHYGDEADRRHEGDAS